MSLAVEESKTDTAQKPVAKVVFLLMFVGFLLRLVFALNTQNIDHPDEIFQYLEPAHRLVFGYGFVTWEYRFGTRSWLLPFLVAVPLFVCQSLGLAEPAVYVPLVKAMFCLFSVSLIFSSYVIARNLISERAGICAAVLCTFWYELIYFSFRPLSDVVAGYFVIAALALLLDRAKTGRPIVFALCTAIAALLRVQYLPVLLFLWVVAAFIWKRERLVASIVSLVLTLFLGGLVDYFTWGTFFASSLNSMLFNGTYNVGVLFTAAREPLWYMGALFSASMGMLAISFLGCLFIHRKLWIPLSCILLLVLTHSMVPSKEYRYIFVAIPLLLISAASLVEILIASRVPQSDRKVAYAVAVIAALLISLGGYCNVLPDERSVYRFVPLSANQPGIEAFNFLARANDVGGILIDRRLWWQCGGYYHLHHRVCLYQPQVDFENCKQADPYVSHMICPENSLCPGFSPIAALGPISIGKSLKPTYEKLPGWSYDILQPGIDDKYKPSVKRFPI